MSERRLLFAILVLGLCLRMVIVFAIDHTPRSDAIAYKSMALNLVQGSGIIDDRGNRAMYNVGYPLFVLTPVFAIFGENLMCVRLMHVFLDACSIVLCYAVAREAGADKNGRLMAAGLWAIYLTAAIYTLFLLKEKPDDAVDTGRHLVDAPAWSIVRPPSPPSSAGSYSD